MSNAQRIIRIAKAEVGYHEGRSGGHWNNDEKYAAQVPGLSWANGQPWCATFVSWCAMKARLAKYYPRTASTDTGARWFQDKGQWSQYPAVAAQGFLGHNGDMFHTFLVARYDDTYVYTVEGNTNDNGSAEGDGVYEHKRLRRDPEIQGYGYPAFPEGLDSADPSYRRRVAPKPKPAPTRGANVDAAIAAASKAEHANPASKRPGKHHKLSRALAWLRKIGPHR
ncbi:hypothetical protein [Nocardioides terrisoli]|uniref:hypothetical protein n=1 Tax=Nocardioides terrisoli TaxID=3388267 RepID=UPI00287BC668|nr:hypothetical protein [Nocardioides marmorisolisilvae]